MTLTPKLRQVSLHHGHHYLEQLILRHQEASCNWSSGQNPIVGLPIDLNAQVGFFLQDTVGAPVRPGLVQKYRTVLLIIT